MQPWNKIIRRSLVVENNIKFQETLVSNDYYFSVVTGFYAKKIKCIPTFFYVYVIRDVNSVSHLKNDKAIEDRVLAYGSVIQFQTNHGVTPDYGLLYSYLYGVLRKDRSMYNRLKILLGDFIPVRFLLLKIIYWRLCKSKLNFTIYCPICNKR